MRIYVVLLVFLTACAQVNIVPQSQSETQLDLESGSITQQQGAISVTLRVGDAHVRPSPVEQNYASFWIEISNQRNEILPVSFQDFSLIDAEGHQYTAQNPDNLIALLNPAQPYLIPYPYVGYYYLGDAERGRVTDQFRSEASYANSRRPDYIKLDSLPEGDLFSGAKVAGTVYFAAELTGMRGFEIRYQMPPLSGQQTLPLVFRFSVEKN